MGVFFFTKHRERGWADTGLKLPICCLHMTPLSFVQPLKIKLLTYASCLCGLRPSWDLK